MVPQIESFAKALCELVRDQAIRNCVADLKADPKSPIGKKWRSVLGDGDASEIERIIVPDCIDEAIFCLLNAIDDGGLRLKFVGPDGSDVDLTEDGLGELAGWYVGVESWRERYSKERFNNYLT